MYQDEILLTDKRFFKDEEEHPYHGEFGNGLATLYRVDCEENEGCPETLLLGYPKLGELSEARKEAIRDYCGFLPTDEITYYEVALKYGRIGRSGLSSLELNLLDRIAHRAKMDWFVTTDEGNFKDGETGRAISPRKAVKDLIEGVDVDSQWFADLDDREKLCLVRILDKLM